MNQVQPWDEVKWQVLWDLALIIGQEERLSSLLDAVMARVSHHTGALAAVVLGREGDALHLLGATSPPPDGAAFRCDAHALAQPAQLVATLWPERGAHAAFFTLAPEEGTLLLFLLAEGEHPDWSSRLSPLLPNLARALGASREHERLALMLAQSAEFQLPSLLLEALPLPLFIQDARGHLVWGNAPFNALLGIEQATQLGLPVESWWPGLGGRRMSQLDHGLILFGGTYRETLSLPSQGDLLCCKGALRNGGGPSAGLVGALLGEGDLWSQDVVLEPVMRVLSLGMTHRDSNTREHELRVMDLAAHIADRLVLSPRQSKALALAAMVHDVGLIRVPAEILVRPRRLTPLEFEFVKAHARDGYEQIRELPLSLPIADIILQHHENLDGSGYPQGLKGEEILLEARILRVADTIEAMLSHRPFRHQFDQEAVLAELRHYSGLWFDARVVEVAIGLLESGYHLPQIPLSGGDHGSGSV
ncbi:response regulator/sensory box/hdig domain-containing protein [Aeromonas diversa CDC 2478-85]|uniref:Response regulator/sensory box/hdig domain-containing protein n=1 Tax=Aeromonas diversa CDC 2478-85 TaxID=1268237 RepID=N9TZV0_9GAMM|nr:HD domain-containing phosphohydrolase [Aeromonas diversa]ENY71590.1 response regulator/sensory box/hdig domain-containing protein [Aeromonas diversa CDC 2478-85]